MKASTTAVIISITVLALGAMVAAVVSPGSTQTVVGFATTTIAGLLLLLRVNDVGAKVDEVRTSINGRMEAHATATNEGAKEAAIEAAKAAVVQLMKEDARSQGKAPVKPQGNAPRRKNGR